MIVHVLDIAEWWKPTLAVVAVVAVMGLFITRLLTREVTLSPGSPGYRPSVQDLAAKLERERVEREKPPSEPDYGDPNEVTVPITKMELLAYPGLYERRFGWDEE